jgi:two-component system response regulator
MTDTKKSLLILMVGRNIDEHNIVKNAMRQCKINHVFTSMYNGKQLMDYLQRRGVYTTDPNRHPSMLIMDIKLDLVKGIEVLSYLHHEHPFKFPTYVITDIRSEEDAKKIHSLGVKEYIQKPEQPEDWQKIITRICRENFQLQM